MAINDKEGLPATPLASGALVGQISRTFRDGDLSTARIPVKFKRPLSKPPTSVLVFLSGFWVAAADASCHVVPDTKSFTKDGFVIQVSNSGTGTIKAVDVSWIAIP